MKKSKYDGKKKPAKMSDSDKTIMDRASLKQLHCEAVALHIVGKLIDCAVEEDVFLSTLQYLNQSHYQDVVEERAIAKMCGYPVCPNIVPDLPNHTYHISAKSNKVFDVTDRKNYCSNFCYTAGHYIKDQMMTSPLWYRNHETIPEFKLLKQPQKIQPGEEIDQGLIKINPDTKSNFTSMTQLWQDFLSEVPDNYEPENDIFGEQNEEKVINKVNKSAKITEIHNLPSTSNENNSTVTSKSEVIDIVNTIEEISLGEKSEVKKTEIIPELSLTDEDFFYSKMFAPSLSDILADNKKYFEDIDKKLNVTTKENAPKIKGILSSKDKGKRKKSVSFHSDTKLKVKEDRIFKKPTPLNTVDDTNVAYKRRITEDSLINKPVIEHKSIILIAHSEENKKIHEINESESVFNKNNANNNKDIIKKIVSEMSKEENFELKSKDIRVNSESNVNVQNIKLQPLEDKDVQIVFTEDEEQILNCTLTDKLKNSENKRTVQKNQTTNKKTQNLEDLLSNNAIQTPKIITEMQNSEDTNSLLNKPVLEHKSLTQKIKDQSFDPLKETRKLGIKNSSTFTQAKILANKFKTNKPEKPNNLDVVIQKINLKSNPPALINESLNKISVSDSLNKKSDSEKDLVIEIKQSVSENFIVRLENCTKEWFTLETMVYLYGEEKVVNYVSDKSLKEHLNERKNNKETQAKKKQNEEICKKISLLELHDRKYDKQVEASKKKPVPSYSELKNKAETMDLRVQAFYSGSFEVIEMDSEETKTDDENDLEVNQGAPEVLPLVENKDFFPLRKKVFLSSLGRTVQKLCDVLEVPQNVLITDLRELVDTFTFDSKNIIFKTAEWPVVSIFLIKLLAFKKTQLADILQLKRSQDYVSSVTRSVFNEDINDFILKLCDSYLNTYVKGKIEE